MFGGIDAIKKGDKVGPNNEVFTLKIGKWECTWNLEEPKGDIPLPRTQHSACEIPGEVLFVFGGYYSTNFRHNDAFLLHIPSMKWSQIPGQESKGEPTNSESPIGAPEPRANHSCNLINGVIYVFGGIGGIQYQRKAFGDLHALDIQTIKWKKVEPNGAEPHHR